MLTLPNPTTLIPILVIASIGGLFYYKQKKGGGISFGSTKKSGPTPTLNAYSVDFTELARLKKIDPVIGRGAEVVRLAQILSRRGKNNAILVGPAGVGKTAIVEGLAERIVKGEVPDSLKNKRLLALEVASLLSGTKYRGEFEQRARKIVQEISSANRSIILFIDEIHSVIQSQGTEGAINFSDILKPALARGDLQMIGATTNAEYEKYIKTDLSLERRFQPIEVREPGVDEAIWVLHGVKDKYREYHHVEFTDAALEAAVKLTKERVADRKLPDKAIDAMDEAAAMVKVSDMDNIVHGILHQAAMDKHPEMAVLWKEIQANDAKILKAKTPASKKTFNKKREELEETLHKLGILTVDSDDIVKVIDEWTETVGE